MKHFIITKFNIPIRFGRSLRYFKKNLAINENLIINEYYLKNRFEIFETFTLPSIQLQTNKNFIWLVFFFDKTPKIFIDKILLYKSICPQFIPYFINEYESTEISKYINHKIFEKEKYTITTRLDNDDALNYNYIDNIQSNIIKIKKDEFFYHFQMVYNTYQIKNLPLNIII